MSASHPVHLTFTPMTLDDLEVIAALEPVCFPAPWSADTYRHELQHNRLSDYWVIRGHGGGVEHRIPPILAYGGYWLMGDEAHIVTLATHPDWRRRRLAEWLLLEMLAVARKRGAGSATLEVRVSNGAAQRLYQKLGFEEVGRRKRYYRNNNEDALLFTLFNLDVGTVWRPLAQQQSILRQLATNFDPLSAVSH